MNSRQRRVRAIELTLTPQQVVLVWLRNAQQAGTSQEGARHSPPHRGTVANAVYETVRNSMKGQSESLVERAILQARREADLLYLVVINANIAVLEGWVQREREYKFLLGYLSAEMHGNPTKDRVQTVRLAVLMFIEPVIVLDAAISKVAEERLTGQPALFRDSTVKLAEQLQMATDLSRWFNRLAVDVGAAEINPEELRNSLQSEAGRRLSIWVSLARAKMLTIFGKTEEIQAAIDRHFLLVDPEPDKGNVGVRAKQD
jgi:hypothetical protein